MLAAKFEVDPLALFYELVHIYTIKNKKFRNITLTKKIYNNQRFTT